MPSPDAGDVHVDTLLTQVSIGWTPGGYIADRLFPVLGVDKQSDKYATYDKSYWARDVGDPGASTGGDFTIRAPGTAARTVGFKVSNNSYFAVNHAIGYILPDEVAANADGAFNLESDAMKLVTGLLRLRRDRKFVADFMTTGIWGTDQTVSNKWSNYGTSSPIEDLRTAIFTLRQQTLAQDGGIIKIVMGALAWRRLSDHPDLLDRIKYTQRGVIGPDLLAALLSESEQAPVEVIIGRAVFTTDEEGTAEASVTYSDVWDDDVLVLWVPSTPSRLAPAAGYTMVWRAMVGGGAVEFARRVRDDYRRRTIIEAHTYFDQVVTNAGSGVFMSDAVD